MAKIVYLMECSCPLHDWPLFLSSLESKELVESESAACTMIGTCLVTKVHCFVAVLLSILQLGSCASLNLNYTPYKKCFELVYGHPKNFLA